MSFHSATFGLLDAEPRILLSARQRLDETELRLGIKLPVSLREWYERESALRILSEHSNDDPPIEVSSFALTQWHSQTLLPIRYENQGVCTWAVNLDGSDDPAVFVDVDTNGKHWNVLAQRFSDYVYSCVWDYKVVLQQPALVQAQNRALTEAAVEALTTTLKPEMVTHGWPGSTQFRFRGSHHGVLIWAADCQTDWFVGARDAVSLRAALAQIWQIDGVGESFYGCTDVGRDVLDDCR